MILDDEMDLRHGALAWINPMTACGLLDCVLNCNANRVILTGSSSHLALMFTNLAKQHGIDIIHIVKEDKHCDMLHQEFGEKYVLNQESKNFEKELIDLVQ